MIHASRRHSLSGRSPSRLAVQPRDVELLRSVLSHRYLRSEHLHALVSPQVSLRVVQSRLKKLHDHGFVKRLYLPVVLGMHRPTAPAPPIYTLSRQGARFLADQSLTDEEVTEQWSDDLIAPGTLTHHLVVTDALVALAVACRSRDDVELVASEHERTLWQRLRQYRKTRQFQNAVVPDGAFTLRYRASGETLTFYLEVVRADVKGGNRRLLEKFQRYAELHRAGFFRDVYGHDRVRAILFATTSPARADNLRRLCAALEHGRRLFWFGTNQEKHHHELLVNLFTAAHVLTLPWMTVDGASVRLGEHAPPACGMGRP